MYRAKTLDFEDGQRLRLIPFDNINDMPRSSSAAINELLDFYDNPNDSIEKLKARAKGFSDNFRVYREITYIDIRNLMDFPFDVNYFPNPDMEQFAMMRASIEDHGLIEPIVVWENPKDKRDYVLCGSTRFYAFMDLYKRTGDEKYLKIPAYYIKYEEIDWLKAKCIVIDSNLQYRTIPKYIKIHAVIERFALYKAAKKYRNETNIARQIANEMDISESSVFNYMKLEKLSPKLMKLLAEGKLKLKPAMMLAANCSLEYQEKMLQRLGIDGLNDRFHEKLLFIRDETDEDVEKYIKIAEDECHVRNVKFSLSVRSSEAYRVFEAIKKVFLEIIAAKKHGFKWDMFRTHYTKDLRNIPKLFSIKQAIEVLECRDIESLIRLAKE